MKTLVIITTLFLIISLSTQTIVNVGTTSFNWSMNNSSMDVTFNNTLATQVVTININAATVVKSIILCSNCVLNVTSNLTSSSIQFAPNSEIQLQSNLIVPQISFDTNSTLTIFSNTVLSSKITTTSNANIYLNLPNSNNLAFNDTFTCSGCQIFVSGKGNVLINSLFTNNGSADATISPRNSTADDPVITFNSATIESLDAKIINNLRTVYQRSSITQDTIVTQTRDTNLTAGETILSGSLQFSSNLNIYNGSINGFQTGELSITGVINSNNAKIAIRNFVLNDTYTASGQLTINEYMTFNGNVSSNSVFYIGNITQYVSSGFGSSGPFRFSGEFAFFDEYHEIGGNFVADGKMLFFSATEIEIKGDTTFSGNGLFVSADYYLWTLNGNLIFDIDVLFNFSIPTLDTILPSVYVYEYTIQSFSPLTDTHTVAFNKGFNATAVLGFKDISVTATKIDVSNSLLFQVDSTLNVAGSVIFRYSDFVPYLNNATKNTFLTCDSIAFYDVNGTNNVKTDNSLNYSSLIPVFEGNLGAILNFTVIKASKMTNSPVVGEPNIGPGNFSIASVPSGLSIEIKPCDKCSQCDGEAPLGTYLCINGSWSDFGGVTIPVVNNVSYVKDTVHLNSLKIFSKNHSLIIYIDNKFLKSLSTNNPIISVNTFALFSGNLTFILTEPIDPALLPSLRANNPTTTNVTVPLAKFATSNGTSFSNIKVTTVKGCNVENAPKSTSSSLSVTFDAATQGKNCFNNKKSGLSSGAIVGIVLGCFFGVVIVTVAVIFIMRKVSNMEMQKFAKRDD